MTIMTVSDTLIKFATSQNIAEFLDEDELSQISDKVESEKEIDYNSMLPWLNRNKEAMEIALQVQESKSFPWQGAANIKYPLITNGAITFASREYPQIVRGNSVVGTATFGRDPDGQKALIGSRISKHMSWQLLVDSDNWESDTDKMLVMLAVVGTTFRKTYYDSVLGKPCFELCRPDHLYINNNVSSLEGARRISHVVYTYLNNIIENMRAGLYTDYDLDTLKGSASDNTEIDANDPDAPHELIEQHRYLDLDHDGYQEPYIVLRHQRSGKILRIVARYSLADIAFTADNSKVQSIKPKQYFTDFHFLPSPNGTFFSFGLGTLLLPVNKTINTIYNQLIDSGTLMNSQPTFIDGKARIDAKTFKLAPGKINKIDGLGSSTLKDSLVNLPIIPPSPVLFSLLGSVTEAGKELAGVTEILSGQQPTQNSPATTVLALIKQGLVQYNAIHKRVLRGFKKEFSILYQVNKEYLDVQKYLDMVDDPAATELDYKLDGLDIRPVSDPNMSSDTQRMMKAQAIYGMPEVDRRAATIMLLKAMDVEDNEINMLVPPIDPNNPPPPPPETQKILAETQEILANIDNLKKEQLKAAVDLEMKSKEEPLKHAELQNKVKETDSVVKLNHALAVKALAEAERTTAEPFKTGASK